MASELPVILGYNLRVVLTTGAGDISMSTIQEVSLEEAPTNKEINIMASPDDEKVFLKNKAKVTLKGLRYLDKCYSDLPAAKQRITNIKFAYVDEDGEALADTQDLPNLIRSAQNPGGYINWAVSEKRGKQEEGAGDFEMVLESGYRNARP